MYTYEDAVKQLQETGSIGLIDFKELSYEDLDELLEEIKKWCVYANGDKKKLKKESKKSKKKDKKKKKDEQGSALWDAQYADVVAATLSVSLGHDPTPPELAAAKTYWLNHR